MRARPTPATATATAKTFAVQLAFGHLSDPHLPLPGGRPPWRPLASKRLLGYRFWHRLRHREHRKEVLAALVHTAATPDHVLVTGDLVNIALPGASDPARRRLEAIGAPEEASTVPGNRRPLGAAALGRDPDGGRRG